MQEDKSRDRKGSNPAKALPVVQVHGTPAAVPGDFTSSVHKTIRKGVLRVRAHQSYAILFERKHSNGGEKAQDKASRLFEHFSTSGECFPSNPKGGVYFAYDIVERS
jgi:hypothetical protein